MNIKSIIIVLLIIIIIILYYFDIYIIDLADHCIVQKNNCKLVINLYNTLHLGDHIFNTYYFNFLKNYLESNNITINYHIEDMYHDQVKEFLQSDNIKIKSLKYIGLNMSVLNITYSNNYIFGLIRDVFVNKSKLVYDKYYLKLFNETSKKLGIELIMNEFIYTNPRLIIEYNNLNEIYKNIDVLIINSVPRTMQVIYDENEWEKFITGIVNLNYKVVTTYKVKNYPCTLDDNLSVFKIGAISTNAKVIIAINTGPTSSIFNDLTLSYCNNIYLMENRVRFSHHKVTNVSSLKELDINEIIKYIY